VSRFSQNRLMYPHDLVARALGVNADAIVSIDPIKHGLTNESWLVRTGNDALVVRVSNRQWTSLQIDRAAESVVLDTVAAAGIGPEIVARDLHHGWLVTRYLGPTCTESQMSEDGLIRRLGNLFRSLHSLRAPEGIRVIHLPAVIDGYLETLDTLDRTSALTSSEMRGRGLALAGEIASSASPCLCHNDVHHLNLVDGEPLRLIDWEYAGAGEAFFDLASVCVYHEYSLRQRSQLLEAYAVTDTERLAKCCWLFEYIRELWLEVRASLDDGK
jgi:thiamine kinase